MQRQLNELGLKIVQEIETLKSENLNLKETIHQLKAAEKCPKDTSKIYQNTDEFINPLNFGNDSNDLIKFNLKTCEQEMNNTKVNCTKVIFLT